MWSGLKRWLCTAGALKNRSVPDVGTAEILAFCLTMDSLSILRFDGSAKVRREASCGPAAGPHLDLLFDASDGSFSPLGGAV